MQGPGRRQLALHAALLAVSVAVWAYSLGGVDPRRYTDLGLVSALPPGVFAGLGVLTLSFCLSLRHRRQSTLLMLAHVGVLIFMLYGITALVEGDNARFTATYKHVGISQFIQQTGIVDARIDAYFNWPGFFIMAAFVSKIAGLNGPMQLILWAPVVFNVLYLGPMVVMMRSASGDARLVWLGVWLFYVFNWVGQDYFSPQGLDFFLYLVLLAILLTWFKSPLQWHRRWLQPQNPLVAAIQRRFRRLVAPLDAPNTFSRPGQRTALIGIIVAILITVISSHQLTPFAILMATAGLVVLNRCSLRFLPILCLVLIGTWVSFMSEIFLSGHVGMVAGHVGQVSSTVNENVTGRVSGSREHQLVVATGLIMTALLWGGATLGALRSLRRGYWDLTFAVLALAPFTLVFLQSYAGELVLRIYLYSLPAMAFFAATLFYTSPSLGRSWRTTILVALVCEAMLGAFLVSRYGNERMDYISPQQMAGLQELYRLAPPHSLLLSGSDNEAWRYTEYTTVTTESLTDSGVFPARLFVHGKMSQVMSRIADLMSSRRYPASFFIITHSEKAYIDLFHVFPPGSLDRLERAMSASPKFRVVYHNPDARIFTLASARKGATA